MSSDLSAPQALHLFARWREAVEARGAARAAGNHELARTHAARALALGDLIHTIPSARLDALTGEVEALISERDRLARELRAQMEAATAFTDAFDEAVWWDGVPDAVIDARRALFSTLTQVRAAPLSSDIPERSA